ncbi:hypothetical protein [Corallococcus sp. AB011P]|uniref:hypothetical protein n=1 Tax=Corallococcus sp. AB011P TaxID=2316735 RepID=UPI0011C34346|nr:hypothetical protein [Corallococcus sp. AB011P]
MEGFQAIDYIDWDPTPQQSTVKLDENIEEILASTPLRGTLPIYKKHTEIEERYVGAMATEILLRGDSRAPQEIQEAGGFKIYKSETGEYDDSVAFHTNPDPRRQLLTCFISTGRSMQIALKAVDQHHVSPGNGWVYAVLARGVDVRVSNAYDAIQRDQMNLAAAEKVVQKKRDKVYQIGKRDPETANKLHDELDKELKMARERHPMGDFEVYRQAEVAVPMEIPWEHVLGFRQVEKSQLTGPLYLRKEFLGFKVKLEVPAFKTKLGIEVYREKEVARLGGQPVRQNKFGITLATVARLSDLFQVSLDRRLLPHRKGYVVSGFPLILNQNWVELEKAMPFMWYFNEEGRARQSLSMGAPSLAFSKVNLYEFDVDAYFNSGVKLRWSKKFPDCDFRIKVGGETASLKRLLYVFRRMESRMVRR